MVTQQGIYFILFRFGLHRLLVTYQLRKLQYRKPGGQVRSGPVGMTPRQNREDRREERRGEEEVIQSL